MMTAFIFCQRRSAYLCQGYRLLESKLHNYKKSFYMLSHAHQLPQLNIALTKQSCSFQRSLFPVENFSHQSSTRNMRHQNTLKVSVQTKNDATTPRRRHQGWRKNNGVGPIHKKWRSVRGKALFTFNYTANYVKQWPVVSNWYTKVHFFRLLTLF